jgi:hypothetical protein
MVRLFEDNGFQLVSRVRFMLWINSLYVFRKAS